jgi:hypothetical protein
MLLVLGVVACGEAGRRGLGSRGLGQRQGFGLETLSRSVIAMKLLLRSNREKRPSAVRCSWGWNTGDPRHRRFTARVGSLSYQLALKAVAGIGRE